MANVNVRFSASIKDLVDATDRVKSAIDGIAETASRANEMLSKFGEFAIAGVGLDQIKDFIKSMAELGEHTEDMAAMLGTSTTSVQELGYIAKMTGGDADSLATAMARFQENLQRAQNPTSQQAQALRALGLSARDLVGIPLNEQMGKLANAFSHFADGGNKSAAAMMLLGRSGVQMIPLLDQGAQGFRRLQTQAETTGAVMSGQTVKSLADLDRALIASRSSATALAGTLTAQIAPALTAAATDFANLAGNIAAVIETGNVWDYLSTDIGTRLEILGLKTTRVAMAMLALVQLNPFQAWKDLSIGQDVIDGLQKKVSGDLAPVIAKAQAQLHALLNTPAEDGAKKPQVPAIDVNRSQENSARMSAMNAEIALDDKQYQQTVAHLNSEQKLGQITEQQKTAAVLAAINQRMAAELGELDKVKAAGGLQVQQLQEIENKKTQIIQKAAADRQKAQDQENQSVAASAKSAADKIASVFSSQLDQVLSHHETFAQAMEKTFASMIEMMISKLVTLIAEWAVLNALAAATGGTGPTFMSLLMPSHADGVWKLPGDEVAQLHAGEMVVPAGPAEGLRQWLGGGASARAIQSMSSVANSSSVSHSDNRQMTVNYHGSSRDQGDIRQLAKNLVDHWQANPSTRPKGW